MLKVLFASKTRTIQNSSIYLGFPELFLSFFVLLIMVEKKILAKEFLIFQ